MARLEDDDSALIMAPLKYDPDAALKRKVPLGTPTAEAMQNALNGNTGGALTLDYRGKEVVAAWRYLPLMKWGIVVHIDVDEAFASVYKLHFVGLVILVLTLLVALFGAVLFNRRVYNCYIYYQ